MNRFLNWISCVYLISWFLAVESIPEARRTQEAAIKYVSAQKKLSR